MLPVVIDARPVFADKRRRDELRRNDPFMLLADMTAAMWMLAFRSFFWAL